MTTAIKRRRGTTLQHATFTGLEGEVTVDTTKDTLVVHDGATAGGYPLLREDLSNNTNVITTTNTKTLTNKTFGDNPTFNGGTANGVAYLNGSKVLTTGSALTFDGTRLRTVGYLYVNSDTDYLRMIDAADSTYIARITRNGSNIEFWNRTGGGLIFGANDSEQMRLTSTGLGIGTTVPSSRLESDSTGGAPSATAATTATRASLSLSSNGGLGTNTKLYAGVGSADYVWIQAQNSGDNSFKDVVINPAGGNLLVGTTSTGNPTTGGFIVRPGSETYIQIGGTLTSSEGRAYFYNGNGYVGGIFTSGTSTSYATSSDYRLKENIRPMQNALDVVQQLNPVRYTWKADGSDGQGFIAHELQAVVPDCVTGEKDAVDEEGNPVYQGIDTSFLTATLSKAIQELHEIVKSQAAEIAELKAKLA